MDTQQERLLHLDHALLSGENICSSEGMLRSFPSSFKTPFCINGVGVVVCRQGSFLFSLNQKLFSAKAGETLFIPEDSQLQVLQESEDMELFILVYQIGPIRDIIGNSVVSMYLYSHLATEPCYVWNTGEEEEVLKYMSLLDSTLHVEENTFNYYEQKLLLLALTYRLCSVYNRKLITERASVGRKHDIFIRLIQLIEQHYKEQRGVEFVPGTGRSPRTAQTQEAKENPTQAQAQAQAQGTENAAGTNKEQRRNTWTNEDGSIRPISKWSNVNFM